MMDFFRIICFLHLTYPCVFLQEENKKKILKNSPVEPGIDIYEYIDDDDRQSNIWEKLLKDSSSRNISPPEKQKIINIVVPAEKDLKNIKFNSDNLKNNDSKKSEKTDGILNLDELDFHPWCNITTKEAVSAIHRATTQACKHEIANITCLMQQGMLYPKRLPRYCPLKGKKCFVLAKNVWYFGFYLGSLFCLYSV